MTEFDVAERTGIAERIPGLARASEVDGTGEVLINGRPAELALGPLHVRVMRCVRADQLPVLGQLTERPQSTAPQPIHGVVAIVNASGDQLLYTDVSLDGLDAN